MARKEVVCSSSSTISKHSPLDFIKDLEEARDKGIDHFAHQHRLEFKKMMKIEKRENEDVHDQIICKACGLEIEGCGFSCRMEENCCFDLHQFCAFLPREITPNYPNHDSQHTLRLYEGSPLLHSRRRKGFKCSLCFKPILSIFHYRCNMCHFRIDVRCASCSILVCGNHHEHLLTPKLYLTVFQCALCYQINYRELDFSYECRTCSFLIHESCYSPPNTIQHGSHVHPLRISYQFQDDPTGSTRYYVCGVCNLSEVLDGNMIYSCEKCKYYVHRHCSIMKWEKKAIEKPVGKYELVEFPMPTPQSVDDILSEFIKQKCDWKVHDIDHKTENLLKHIACHDHPLVLNDFNNLTVSDRSCNACSLLVSDDSFYSCTQLSCNFVLHKWCANLPCEMQHPTHPGHTLLLHERHDESFGLFNCAGCLQIGNGFVYKCSEIECKEEFYLDVICACFPSYVKHETHEHPLIFNSDQSIRCCNSCGRNIKAGFAFGCDACTFSIDIRCLLLPREITHWYDREHGFKLTYDIPVCEQGYYCEFCEEELDTNNWIYHCFECDWSLDTICVTKAFALFQGSMVLGGSQYIPHHKRLLTCALVPREWHTFCNECGQNNYENDGREFRCTECKIVFCTNCVMGYTQKLNELVSILNIDEKADTDSCEEEWDNRET